MILFMEHDLDKARNMKVILSAFEQLSGLNRVTKKGRPGLDLLISHPSNKSTSLDVSTIL
jgi:predicted helicase